MSALIPVRLLKRHTLYNEGEVAGFPPDAAAQLIARGHAEAYDAVGITGDGSGDSLPPLDESTDSPPPASGEGQEGAGEGKGEGEKAPSGDGTTPPAATTPKPKGKK